MKARIDNTEKRKTLFVCEWTLAVLLPQVVLIVKPYPDINAHMKAF